MTVYISGSKTVGSPNCYSPGGLDPLAQSFFVDTPLVLTKVDLFFYTKDDTLPVKIQIRKMVNGYPGPEIIPFSETVVYPASITETDDGSTATSISFKSPVYLDIGEYAIVLLTDSLNYRVWISQIGEADSLTDSLISEQPYIGVLFKSQNASTWEPNQYQDLKFTLYRASFDTTSTATVQFVAPDNQIWRKNLDIDPLEVYPNSNIMRVYHPEHGQNAGSYVRITGLPSNNISLANADFYGITLSTIENVPFAIDQTTLNSYTITLPSNVNSNVTSTIRTGGRYITVTEDFRYDTYYPAFGILNPPGTDTTHKVKTTAAITYTVDSAFTTIDLDDTDFSTSRTLASNVNKIQAMSNSNSFIHQVEMSTTTEFLSPIIDTKRVAGVFARNLLNNPTYDSENKSNANDVVTIANNGNIIVTQTAGVNGYGLITFTTASNIANAATIIKGTYINITSNNATNDGQYRVIDVTDSGANVSIYNISGSNVTTDSTARYDITYGRNFIAEESAFDGSAYSKYITRQVDFVNPCTAFKFYIDTVKPTDTNIKFYYKISEAGDTIDLKNKEYTEITGVTIPTSVAGEFYEVTKLVENLPQFDAIVFKIVFLGDTVNTNLSQTPKCKNLRIVALA